MGFSRFPVRFKVIKKGGAPFLYRVSIALPRGSIKIHLIVNDDIDDAHIHPWTFSSFLALGAYKEEVDGKVLKHPPFAIVHYPNTKRHKVVLYEIFGQKIPCLTVGLYSEKIQPWCHHKDLCEYCEPFGSCQDKAYWEAKSSKADRLNDNTPLVITVRRQKTNRL